MSHSGPKTALGFLTVRNNEESGLIGGYLILNEVGRPLEFHCTAPVKPNRAQQILFGPTLEPFLYGEQIGQTLLAKSSLEPLAVYTDVAAALAVRDFVKTPVALVLGGAAAPDGEAIREADSGRSELAQSESAATWRLDAAHSSVRLATFSLGNNRLAVYERHRRDQDDIQQRQATLADFDLAEPFERIREAIEEAHKQSRV
jgi:hypothetical protein